MIVASAIDPTKPTATQAFTADVRSNFLAAKNEIEALQSGSFLPLAGGTLTGSLKFGTGATYAANTITMPTSQSLTFNMGGNATNLIVSGQGGTGEVARFSAVSGGNNSFDVTGTVNATRFNASGTPLVLSGSGANPRMLNL